MKRSYLLISMVVTALAVGWAIAGSAPAPATTPITWELDFEPLDVLRPIRIVLPGQTKATTFWYLRYRIFNDTGEDRQFIPSFDLCTNTGQLFNAKTAVPRVVFDKIKAHHNQPLLKNLAAMTGKILQGEDNAKDGVAIWPDFDAGAGRAVVFIGQLSGEQRVLKLPQPVEVTMVGDDGKERTITVREVVLHKTRQLTYEIPSEPAARFTTPTRLVDKRWIMR
ncbi:hypothetical protein LCGC14_0451530 [marine sediment metagenome]|uniref:Uncharacterized protein n=1 Tax=marine sediment metagenome TaxID=412755 RepID=A0A0F9SHM7_9ZZZZ|nr:hypothetical protein [Phycisphaerae bacterium]HDZ43183.1 hypothetical protein [Phycisphaerae bacterium]